jgi:hypothetical protein
MFAFMAIVAHYVNKDGGLSCCHNTGSSTQIDLEEELLINFCELVRKHSGENMAKAVWDMFMMYGIERRVCSPILDSFLALISFQVLIFMLDNASNNDTLVDGIEHCAQKVGMSFKSSWVQL